jgi:two-component system phosphate regulon sensor histidine kinase PhoR|tara:strand:+ start:1877 stop:3160 length:1284 start_codon:yes stop_codon:yes gene_type:complete
MPWDYWRLLTVVSLSGFIGLLFGQMMTFMFIATLLYAVWIQHSWYKLSAWLRNPKKNQPPEAEGVVNDVCRDLEQMRRQNKSRKKKLTGYLKRFQSATAALPDAVVVLGSFGEVMWVNASAEALLGITCPRDKSIRVNNLIRDPVFQKLIIDPAMKGKAVSLTSPVNKEIKLEIKIVSYMGNARMLIARDMTPILKLQQMRRDFVANVSHELRTPLTVISGYLEIFSSKTPPEQWKKALPAMRQQAARMSGMLQELLALSHLESGEKPLNLVSIDINTILQEVITEAMKLPQYDKHMVELNLDVDHSLLADMDELRSVLSNIIFNAVRYTPPACRITVTWGVNEQEGVISVKDEGNGIPEHHLDRLTERFYRVDNGRALEDGGTGLGLAIVKHVLQRHGAMLRISSNPGHGSTFSCHFPLENVLAKS